MEYPIHTLLYRTVHRQRNVLRPYLRALGLGTGQPRLLTHLVQAGPCSQKHLADHLEVDPSAVCRMLDSLEKGGFVVRGADKTDRRAGLVEITEKGRCAVADWQRTGRAIDRRMLGGFTEAEARQLVEYLERVSANLQQIGRGPLAEKEVAP